jgi:hypothetical protein
MRSTVEVRRTGARRPTWRALVSPLNPLLRVDTLAVPPLSLLGSILALPVHHVRVQAPVASGIEILADMLAFLLSNVDHRIVDKLTIER